MIRLLGAAAISLAILSVSSTAAYSSTATWHSGTSAVATSTTKKPTPKPTKKPKPKPTKKPTPKPSTAHLSIDIVAANWKFTPNVITLHVNQPTTLRLTSSQGVHGLQSSELGIPQTMISPGKYVSVVVTPKKAGTFVVHCSIMCGAGHPNMTLTVKVE
jgi:cytochrome c oxidase subunit II